ncbi:hypothetical protein PHLCEN_2v2441 [Hermanssonia centrifuga]|uniref:Uncharacterized protein n=1 Tax=Hermanssonia centrifuga TaxID=98765 RepID=A0A2R6RLY0_9APHY|nr:hypothetical protein PHLCEN_2v2441 [Hermanssonia centrifuga]
MCQSSSHRAGSILKYTVFIPLSRGLNFIDHGLVLDVAVKEIPERKDGVFSKVWASGTDVHTEGRFQWNATDGQEGFCTLYMVHKPGTSKKDDSQGFLSSTTQRFSTTGMPAHARTRSCTAIRPAHKIPNRRTRSLFR